MKNFIFIWIGILSVFLVQPIYAQTNGNPFNNPVEGTLNIETSGHSQTPAQLFDYFKQEFYKVHGIPYDQSEGGRFGNLEREFKNGIGNVMQDKWSDPMYKSILEKSLRGYVNEKFPKRIHNGVNSDAVYDYHKYLIQSKDANCMMCKIARYEFVGFFFPTYLKTLREGRNPALNKQISDYTNYLKSISARKKLESWKIYSRSETAKLTKNFYDPAGSWDPTIGPHIPNTDPPSSKIYPLNTFGTVFMGPAVPLPGKTVSEFKQKYMGDPFLLSGKQQQTRFDFLSPMLAQANPNVKGVAQEIKQFPSYLLQNMSKEAASYPVLAEFLKASGGVAVGGTSLFALHLSHSVHFASKNLSIMKGVISGLGQKAKAASLTLWNAGGGNALAQSIGKALGPFTVGVAIFMAGFQNTGGKAIEIAIFEQEMKNMSRLGTDRIDWNRLPRMEITELTSYLFKMLVLDPSDFTYLIPGKKANINEVNQIELMAATWAQQNHPNKFAGHLQRVRTKTQGPTFNPQLSYVITDAKHGISLVAGLQSGGDNAIHHKREINQQNSRWSFKPAGDGYYYIFDRMHNKAIVAGDVASNQVYHQNPEGRLNAQWSIIPSGVAGKYTITDRKHGKSLVAGTNYDGRVYHQPSNNSPTAYWSIEVKQPITKTQAPLPTFNPQLSYVITDVKHGISLVAGLQSGGDNAIHHKREIHQQNSRWSFKPAGDGYYYIFDRMHNKAIIAGDVANNQVYHQNPSGRLNAQWRITPSSLPGKYIITDRKHGKSLVAGSNYDGRVYHQPSNNSPAAYWSIEVKQPLINTQGPPTFNPQLSYVITDGKHGISLVAGLQSGGDNVVHHKREINQQNSKWSFKPAGDGYYYIFDRMHNKAIIAGDVANNQVYHQNPGGRLNAQWKITQSNVPGKYIITDRKHGKSLVAGSNYDGQVYHQSSNNSPAAYWSIQPL